MTADDCRDWRELLGPYILGQLPDSERAAMEAHLEGCPDCRAEAETLSPMATMLRRADPERLAPAAAPPPDLGDRIAQRIAAERGATRRRRIRFGIGLGAATAAATAAVLLAVFLSGGSTRHSTTETVAFNNVPHGVSVNASLASRPWGSDVSVRVRGFRPGTLCTVWVRRRDGTRVPAGSFRYVYAGESDEANLSTGLDPRDVTAVGLQAGSKTFVAPIHSRALSPAQS